MSMNDRSALEQQPSETASHPVFNKNCDGQFYFFRFLIITFMEYNLSQEIIEDYIFSCARISFPELITDAFKIKFCSMKNIF